MSLADASREAVGWQLILDAVKAKTEEARRRLDEEMANEGSLKQGVQGWGTVTRTGGQDDVEVHDPDALLHWTATHRPDMLVQRLNPSWVELLKIITLKEGLPIDPETGAVIPGMRRVQKPTGLMIRTTREARDGARAVVSGLATGAIEVAPREEGE